MILSSGGTIEDIGNIVARELNVDSRSPIAAAGVMGMLTRLEGRNPTRRDLLAAATVGGALRLVDDVYDSGSIEDAESRGSAVTSAVLDTGIKPVIDSRISQAIQLARDSFSPQAYATLQDLMRAQTDSVQQRHPSITNARIEAISRAKATFFPLAVQANPSMTAERTTCYKELAYLMQLIDDYRDRHQDSIDGIHTLVTRANSDVDAIILILRQYRRVRVLFSQEYEAHQLIEPFGYIDQMLRASGIV